MDEIEVEVCYARPEHVFRRILRVPAGCTVGDAIARSGLLDAAPEVDPAHCRVGVYGKLKAWDTPLRARDRVEIYRPLVADPMEARRRRAAHKQARKAG